MVLGASITRIGNGAVVHNQACVHIIVIIIIKPSRAPVAHTNKKMNARSFRVSRMRYDMTSRYGGWLRLFHRKRRPDTLWYSPIECNYPNDGFDISILGTISRPCSMRMATSARARVHACFYNAIFIRRKWFDVYFAFCSADFFLFSKRKCESERIEMDRLSFAHSFGNTYIRRDQ